MTGKQLGQYNAVWCGCSGPLGRIQRGVVGLPDCPSLQTATRSVSTEFSKLLRTSIFVPNSESRTPCINSPMVERCGLGFVMRWRGSNDVAKCIYLSHQVSDNIFIFELATSTPGACTSSNCSLLMPLPQLVLSVQSEMQEQLMQQTRGVTSFARSDIRSCVCSGTCSSESRTLHGSCRDRYMGVACIPQFSVFSCTRTYTCHSVQKPVSWHAATAA